MKQKDPHSGGAACDAVVRALGSAHGLDVSVYDEVFLRKSIDKRLAATGFETVAAYGDYLAGSREEATAFYGSLRIGYSEFFRSPLVFELLKHLVLPSLAAEKARSNQGEIRVWSAGCAAGQEAWSIAMLLDEVAGTDSPSFSYRIFATDLSEPDLALANAGVYSDEALGNVRLRQLSTFFSRQGDAHAVLPRLRESVCFSSYDLLDERSSSPAASIYGDFDLVFCCNLLFYYRQDIRQRILDKVCRALAPGGYFVTGEAERDIVSNRIGLCAVSPPAAIFQKRREKA
jgi:chemotaxis methyl-accepting protein methylase